MKELIDIRNMETFPEATEPVITSKSPWKRLKETFFKLNSDFLHLN